MASSISLKTLNKLMAASNLESKSFLRPLVRLPADPISFTVRSIGEDDSSDDEKDDRALLARFGRSVPNRSDAISGLISTSSRGRSVPTTRETGEALHIRFEMPGLSKEDVTLTVRDNTLVIKGEAKKGPDEEEAHFVSGKFESKFGLTEKLFMIKEVKAEIKNGVLKLIVPKVKDEAQADVININVD